MRPREFDETEVAERALLVFWKQGYAATSVEELVKATGVQRQSLYNTFGDKHGLFLRALERYHQRVDADLAALGGDGGGLEHIRHYLHAVIAAQQSLGVGACLMVQTAFTAAVDDPQVRKAVERSAARVRQELERVLRSAQARGELRDGLDTAAAAACLYAVLNGASALVRTGAPAEARQAIDLSLSSLARPRSGRPLRARCPPRPRAKTNRRGARGPA